MSFDVLKDRLDYERPWIVELRFDDANFIQRITKGKWLFMAAFKARKDAVNYIDLARVLDPTGSYRIRDLSAKLPRPG